MWLSSYIYHCLKVAIQQVNAEGNIILKLCRINIAQELLVTFFKKNKHFRQERLNICLVNYLYPTYIISLKMSAQVSMKDIQLHANVFVALVKLYISIKL